MKKTLALILAAILVLSFCACSGGAAQTSGESAQAAEASDKYAGRTLHIYTPGEYIGEELIPNFEKKFGCRVVVDLFESNEQMYIKVANGDVYDVLIPSDYMIERLKQEDLLQPLDKQAISNISELDPAVLAAMDFDPQQEYGLPYFWGTVGLMYDRTVVDEADLQAEGFGILNDQKYKGNIYLYDSERDMMMVALKYLGYSMNTENEAELNEAYDFLHEVVTTMDPEIVTDEIIDAMAEGRKAIGIMYSGDAVYGMCENENMNFFMPEAGTNLWIDCMVIPKNAENVELANEFINYVCSYEASLDNSRTVGYTSPNSQAAKDLYAGDFAGIDAYIPRTDNPNDETFHYSEAGRKIMADLWSRVKIAAANQ